LTDYSAIARHAARIRPVTPREFFEASRERDQDLPALPVRPARCHDCAVTCGLYTELSDELAKLDDIKDEVSQKWFCHTNPNMACRGNAENCGVVSVSIV
jgi:hypothetical protein